MPFHSSCLCNCAVPMHDSQFHVCVVRPTSFADGAGWRRPDDDERQPGGVYALPSSTSCRPAVRKARICMVLNGYDIGPNVRTNLNPGLCCRRCGAWRKGWEGRCRPPPPPPPPRVRRRRRKRSGTPCCHCLSLSQSQHRLCSICGLRGHWRLKYGGNVSHADARFLTSPYMREQEEGNRCFKKRKYKLAIAAYSDALKLVRRPLHA